jgi:rRNA maturation endonuclease Nob1
MPIALEFLEGAQADLTVMDLLLNIALATFVLGSGVVATQIYVKLAYFKCAGCGSLNAKRRSECRVCGHALS